MHLMCLCTILHGMSSLTSQKRHAYVTAAAIVVAVLLWLILGGIYTLVVGSDQDEEEMSFDDFPKVSVVSSSAQKKVRMLNVYGNAKPKILTRLKSQTSGKIATIVAREGSFLKQGDVILALEKEDKPQQVEEAKALLKQRDLEYKAAKSLFKKGHKSETELAKAFTELQNAQTNLATRQLMLSYTSLRAPFDGWLDKVEVEEGDVVKANETLVGSFIDDTQILILGHVPEKFVTSLTEGELVEVQFLDGRKSTGYINFISRIASDVTRTYEVQVTIDNVKREFASGMTAQLMLPTTEFLAHAIKPSYLALNAQGDIGVKVVIGKDLVKFYAVEVIGHEGDTMWVAGLPEQATIISLGQGFVSSGQRVMVVR